MRGCLLSLIETFRESFEYLTVAVPACWYVSLWLIAMFLALSQYRDLYSQVFFLLTSFLNGQIEGRDVAKRRKGVIQHAA